MKADFLEAMSKAANSVYIVTTDGDGGKVGVTVSAVTSVSADTPEPSLLICVHHDSPATQAMRINSAFCVNLLAEDHAHISDKFAGLTGAKGIEKFNGIDWLQGTTGCPIIRDSLAAFDCTLVHDIRVGSRHIFIGELKGIQVSDNKSALIHTNRQYCRTEAL